MSTPRAAALAGVAFGLLMGAALILIRIAVPDGAPPGSDWVDAAREPLRAAAVLMPFAGIAFLWFIGVLRDGFGRYEDKFFSSVLIGSGLTFLAMMFAATAVGVALTHGGEEAAAFGQALLTALSKTYALRMAAVFMMSLATMWLRTGLMPRWVVWGTYLVAAALIVAADVSMWLTLAFPAWVLVISLVLLARAGVITVHWGDDDTATGRRSAAPRRGTA